MMIIDTTKTKKVEEEQPNQLNDPVVPLIYKSHVRDAKTR